MKYILKEIVSRNGLGTDTYHRHARWAGVGNQIVGFDSYIEAKMEGQRGVNTLHNGIVDFCAEAVL